MSRGAPVRRWCLSRGRNFSVFCRRSAVATGALRAANNNGESGRGFLQYTPSTGHGACAHPEHRTTYCCAPDRAHPRSAAVLAPACPVKRPLHSAETRAELLTLRNLDPSISLSDLFFHGKSSGKNTMFEYPSRVTTSPW